MKHFTCARRQYTATMAVMSLRHFSEAAYADFDPTAKTVAILPVGATEAHGPHLPLGTDVIIAEAMARNGGERLSEGGLDVWTLPSIAYSVTDSAAGFSGTITLRPETASAVLVDIGRSLLRHKFSVLCIANAHLEPKHIASIQSAEQILAKEGLTVIFPDVTQKPWALRLTSEFKSGACHAGCYEGSIVMAERPELVREDVQSQLSPNLNSLSVAFKEGKTTFEEAGGCQAYFGDPAAATATEGRDTVLVLGEILAEAVLDRLKL